LARKIECAPIISLSSEIFVVANFGAVRSLNGMNDRRRA
jgi:hypothetical protein